MVVSGYELSQRRCRIRIRSSHEHFSIYNYFSASSLKELETPSTLHSGLREVWPSRMDPLTCHHSLELLDNCSSTQSIRFPISFKWCSIDQVDSLRARFSPKQALALTVLVDAAALLLARLKKSSAVNISSWLCRRCVDVPFGRTALVVVARMRSQPYHGHDCRGLLHGH